MGWSRGFCLVIAIAVVAAQNSFVGPEYQCTGSQTPSSQNDLRGLCSPLSGQTGCCTASSRVLTAQQEAVARTCTPACQRLFYAFQCRFSCLTQIDGQALCTTPVANLTAACSNCGAGSQRLLGTVVSAQQLASALNFTLRQDNCVDFTTNARALETTLPVVSAITVNPQQGNPATGPAVSGCPNLNQLRINGTFDVQSQATPLEAVVECLLPGTNIAATSRTYLASDFVQVSVNAGNNVVTYRVGNATNPVPLCELNENVNSGIYRVNIRARNTVGTTESVNNAQLASAGSVNVTSLFQASGSSRVLACQASEAGSVLGDCTDAAGSNAFLLGSGTTLGTFQCCPGVPCTLVGSEAAAVSSVENIIANGDNDELNLLNFGTTQSIESIQAGGRVLLTGFRPGRIQSFVSRDNLPAGQQVTVLARDSASRLTFNGTCTVDINSRTVSATSWLLTSAGNSNCRFQVGPGARFVLVDSRTPELPQPSQDGFQVELARCAPLRIGAGGAFEVRGANNAVADLLLRGNNVATSLAVSLCGDIGQADGAATSGDLEIVSGYVQVSFGYVLYVNVVIGANSTTLNLNATSSKALTTAVLPAENTAVLECWCSVCGRDVEVRSGGALLLGRPFTNTQERVNNQCNAFASIGNVTAGFNPNFSYRVRSLSVAAGGRVAFRDVAVNGPALWVGTGGAGEANGDDPFTPIALGGGTAENINSGVVDFAQNSIIEVQLDLSTLPTTASEIVLMRYRDSNSPPNVAQPTDCEISATLQVTNQNQIPTRVATLSCRRESRLASVNGGADGPFVLFLSVPQASQGNPSPGSSGSGVVRTVNVYTIVMDRTVSEFPSGTFVQTIGTLLNIPPGDILIVSYSTNENGDIEARFRCQSNDQVNAAEICNRIIAQATTEGSALNSALKTVEVDQSNPEEDDDDSNKGLYGLFALIAVPLLCCCAICLILFLRKRKADNQYRQDTATFSNVASSGQPINTLQQAPLTYPQPYAIPYGSGFYDPTKAPLAIV